MEYVTPEQLIALADLLLPKTEVAQPAASDAAHGHAVFGRSGSFDLERWIYEARLDVTGPKPWKGGGRVWEFRKCPWNPAHDRGEAFISQQPDGAIAAGCPHNSCKGNDWSALRDLVEPGWRERREARTTAYSPNGTEDGSEGIIVNKVNLVNSVELENEWPQPIPFRRINLPPFPVHALPDWLAEFVDAEAEATQTPRDLAGLLALAACAVAVAGKTRVVVRPGWVEPTNLFVAVAMLSGTRKTVVFDDATRPLDEWEQWENEDRAAEIARAASQEKILQRRLDKAQAMAAKVSGPEAELLEHQAADLAEELARFQATRAARLLADDCTPERLATLLMEQGGRMAVMSDEGGIFDIMAGRYSSSGAPNLDVYLKGHSGGTLRVDRVGRPPEYVRNPALTVGLAVQPEVIRTLAEKPGFKGKGLIARFLFSVPHDLVGGREVDPPPVPDEVRAAYHRNLTQLLAISWAEKRRPHLLALDDAGREVLYTLSRWLEPQLRPDASLEHLRDWGGKLAGTAARIAAIFELATQAVVPSSAVLGDPWAPGSELVRASMVERAVTIGHYLVPHARAAHAMIGADPMVEEARRMLGWVERNGEPDFSRRDLFRALQGRFQRVQQMDPALDLLCQHGYLREVDAPRPAGGGGAAARPEQV